MKEYWKRFKRHHRRAFKRIHEWNKNTAERLKTISMDICKWVGYDGLLNLETCALLVFIFNLGLDEIMSAILAIIIAVIKTCYDKYKSGHDGEMHDFICCLVGVLLAIIVIGFRGYFGII